MGKELIDKVFQKFENHINIENNNRIIFSGKFGIGKSYFLNEFFKDENYKKEYFPIFLNPVNYSVSSNQDIFELIKFDILFQIIDKNIVDFDNFDFPAGNLIYQYFSNKFLNDFISNVDLLGETVIEEQLPKSYSILKNLGQLISKISEVNKSDFDNFKKEIEANPDLKIIRKFFDKEEIKIGSIYENNAVSQLIYQLMKSIETKNEKKTVLVIDDLDRIDPEHIFRILNIFSAHNKENENKFGFQKIVLVCDIKNIESIYHHFYGANTDFFGYINKFYSLEIYKYSNKDYLKWFNQNFMLNDNESPRNSSLIFIKYVIENAIVSNLITARQLFNQNFSKESILKTYTYHRSKNYDNVYYEGRYADYFNVYRENYAILKTILYYLGSTKKLIDCLSLIDRSFLKSVNSIDNLFANFIGLAKFYKPTSNTVYMPVNFYGFNVRSTNQTFILQNENELLTNNLVDFFKDLKDVLDSINIIE